MERYIPSRVLNRMRMYGAQPLYQASMKRLSNEEGEESSHLSTPLSGHV